MRLYIGNLPWKIIETDLLEIFAGYGVVEGTAKIIKDRETGKSKGYGFLEVQKGDIAVQEMNGKEILGRSLKVSEALRFQKKVS